MSDTQSQSDTPESNNDEQTLFKIGSDQQENTEQSEQAQPGAAVDEAQSNVTTQPKRSNAQSTTSRLGDLGRYKATREVGRGGMGRVLLAMDEQFGREVAIKELLARATKQKGSSPSDSKSAAVERFLREARVTGRLEHPGIIPVYEIGERDDGSVFYSMKFIRGESLADRLESISKNTSLDDAGKLRERLKLLDHFTDICEAIAYAHSRGVIHRDLKPDNVMLGDFGETLVVDWGLAKVLGESDEAAHSSNQSEQDASNPNDSNATLDGSILGTPAYMPPEQARGELKHVNPLSDVYSLGAILYEILTGAAPFKGMNAAMILTQVLEDSPQPVLSLAPDAPRELANLCELAMKREQNERLQSAKELADEVRAYREGRALSGYQYSLREVVTRFVKKNKRTVSVAALLVLAMLIGGGVIWQERRAEFADLVEARQSELAALQAEADAMGVDQLLQQIETYSQELRFTDADGDPFALRPAIARNNTLTPNKRDETLAAVQQAFAWAGVQRSRLNLAQQPVRGESVELLSATELNAALSKTKNVVDQAITLATLAEHHTAARTALVAFEMDESEQAKYSNEIDTAADSLVNAWVTLANAAIDDMEAGRSREGRTEEFREEYGMVPLEPEEWVKRLIGYRDERVAQALADRLTPYTEKAREGGEEVFWTDPDRDALHIILETLGDIQQAHVAVPALGAFLQVAHDPTYAMGSSAGRPSLVVQCGLALCATESEEADEVLHSVLQGRLGNSPEARQINRRRSRAPESSRFAEPQRAAEFNGRGNARSEKGDLDGAIADYDQAIRLDPKYARAWANRATTRLAKGDFDGAIADFDQAIQLDPKVAAAWNGRGNARYVKGDLDGAIADYDQAIALDPKDAGAWNGRGNARQQKGDLDGAIADYDQAIQLDPKDANAWMNRGIARRAKGDLDGAIADYDQAIRLDPKDAGAWNNRGLARRAKGDLDGAIADFDQAIQLDPKDANAWMNRGIARFDKGDLDGAIADLDQAIRLDPNNANAWMNRGIARYDKGDLDGAIADYTKAIEINRQYPNAWANLGLIRVRQRVNSSALRHYRHAISIAPQWQHRATVEGWANACLPKLREQGAVACVELSSIADDSQASRAQLNRLDVIHAINGEALPAPEYGTAVASIAEKLKALPAGEEYTLTIHRYQRVAVLDEFVLKLARDDAGELILDENQEPRWEYEEITVTLIAGEQIGITLTEQYLPKPTLENEKIYSDVMPEPKPEESEPGSDAQEAPPSEEESGAADE